jgi:hypothetical protein
LALYREHHVRHMIALIFKAIGLSPRGRLSYAATWLGWLAVRYRAARLARSTA